jgi:hypothetical protein
MVEQVLESGSAPAMEASVSGIAFIARKGEGQKLESGVQVAEVRSPPAG